MSEYFDEEYEKNINTMSVIFDRYNKLTGYYISILEEISKADNGFLDKETFISELNKLKYIVESNISIFKDKMANPSAKFSLCSISEVLNLIFDILSSANKKIIEFNESIKHINEEKLKLKGEIWKFILSELNNDISEYKTENKKFISSINSITAKITQKEVEINKLREQVSDLEKSKTNTLETVESINNLLQSFGFVGFKIKQLENQNYILVRQDDSIANKTLSEGERTFIAFLYFYHLIKGSISKTGINTDRIIVIDDPISSLDNDILFIVTTLIRNIRNQIYGKDESHFKQLFILTHNPYFYRQVSFYRNGDSGKNDSSHTYWIIRKNNFSTVEKYERNPITTSYEMLWNDVANAKITPSIYSRTICNTLRRIIEHYFKLLGNYKEKELLEKFPKEDIMIVESLFSWLNAGSHNVFEDTSYVASDKQILHYLDVFKLIFQYTGHDSHYSMMMKEKEKIISA